MTIQTYGGPRVLIDLEGKVSALLAIVTAMGGGQSANQRHDCREPAIAACVAGQ